MTYEEKMDHLLHIETGGSIRSKVTVHHNGYEPTDYKILDLLIEKNLFNKEDVVIDFGCGKGRVDFYLRYKIGCRCIGIEYNELIYQFALNNLEKAKMDKIELINQDASLYSIPYEANIFYYFNPFSLEILQKTLHNILNSYYASPRHIYFIFYYPSDEYIYYLTNVVELNLVEQINTNDLYNTHQRQECIFIFEIKKE